MAAEESGAFLAYHEPNIVSILTLISFFVFLAVAEWLADKLIRASLIGHIIVGLIYGMPLGNILAPDWQETFLALGYIGLILIIFEGGLSIRLDLLRQNLPLSLAAALLGVLTPIALSFALIYAGFRHTALEAFILGTALCSTSLGTTFVVLTSASKSQSQSQLHSKEPTSPVSPPAPDYSQTRIGTVLVGAALLDDVAGLILVSVIHNLRDIGTGSGQFLGWIIGRPVVASFAMAVVTPLLGRFVAAPGYRWFMKLPLVVKAGLAGHAWNGVVMVGVLSAFLAVAAYAGASVLFGAFLAGAFVGSLAGSGEEKKAPEFTETFEGHLGGPLKYVFQPLFFASIGFAIPFRDLWTGEVIWKGVVYTLLMTFGKLVVGIVVPIWDLVSSRRQRRDKESGRVAAGWAPATLLGAAMVARGEIGLLIIQVGLNETAFLSQKAFVIGIWAIVLNTIIGPVMVGILLKRAGTGIANHARWGIQARRDSDLDDGSAELTELSGAGPRPVLG